VDKNKVKLNVENLNELKMLLQTANDQLEQLEGTIKQIEMLKIRVSVN
jgi:hypothetical protein